MGRILGYPKKKVTQKPLQSHRTVKEFSNLLINDLSMCPFKVLTIDVLNNMGRKSRSTA